jgi:dipeptidyl-peptidase-4
MGIHGWSFGGFMPMSMMSRNPGVFKAGVAGGPVIDWSYYEVMYTERYMDTPAQNPEGFEKSNLVNHIDDLDGELLIIHGTSDDVVVWQHTQIYLKEAVEAGKQVDYFVYPMHKHNVRGTDRIHLMQKVTDYFEGNLR